MKPVWRIYYIDSTIESFSSLDGEPCDAPIHGVGVIVQKNPDSGREMVMRHDFYYWVPSIEMWWGSDLTGMIDQFSHFPKDRMALKIGRNTSDAKWKEIVEKAIQDNDFAPLSRPIEQVSKKPSSARGQWSGYGDKIK